MLCFVLYFGFSHSYMSPSRTYVSTPVSLLKTEIGPGFEGLIYIECDGDTYDYM